MKLVRVAAIAAVLAAGCDSVGEAPGAPMFVSEPATNARVGILHEDTVLAIDPDGKFVGYALDVGPQGMTLDESTGAIAWTPAANQVGTHEVVVTAQDSADESAMLRWFVTVGVNRAPEVFGAGLVGLCSGETVTGQISAVDPDGDDVTLELLETEPGVTLDVETGTITVSGNALLPALTVVRVRATDAFGAETFFDQYISVAGFNGDVAVNTPVSVGPESAEELRIAPMADGTVVIVYQAEGWDPVNALDTAEVRMTRLDVDGCLLESETPLAVFDEPGDQAAQPRIVPIDDGAYVSWLQYDYTTDTVVTYAQRLDLDGAKVWAAAGVPVSDRVGQVDLWHGLVATQGGAVASWRDITTTNIYVQKLGEATGAPAWGSMGLVVTSSGATGDAFGRNIADDGAGGAVVVWQVGTTEQRGQRIAANGTRQWGATGVQTIQFGANNGAEIIRNGDAWFTVQHNSAELRVQKLDSAGTRQWGVSGVSGGGSQSFTQGGPTLASTSDGGVYTGARFSSCTIRIRRYDAAGVVAWTDDQPIYNCAPDQGFGVAAAGDEPIATWIGYDYGIGDSYTVFAQRWSETGTPLWGEYGRIVSSVPEEFYGDGAYHFSPVVVVRPEPGTLGTAGPSRALFGWADYRNDRNNEVNADLFLQQLEADGSPGVFISGGPDDDDDDDDDDGCGEC